MLRQLTMLLVGAMLVLSVREGTTATPESVKADEAALRDSGVGTDAAALTEYFHKRTLADTDKAKIQALIKQLGDDEFSVRESATKSLIALGPVALSLLRAGLMDEDLEIAKRAQAAVEAIEKNSSPAMLRAAARLLAERKPADAAETLLAYLPFAEDANVAEEVAASIRLVAVRAGKVDPVVAKALSDKLAVKRAAAGEALVSVADQRAAVRKLLKDTEPLVRLRVGLALVEARDKEAIPVLIALLNEKTKLEVSPVEDLLYLIAGDKAPTVDTGRDAEGRRKYREAWEKWWADNGKALDLAKFDPAQRQLGHTLIAAMETVRVGGRVFEIDRDGKVKWQIDGLNYPIDAQVVNRDHVLISEYRTRTVSERTFKGDTVWTKTFTTLVIGARRMPNGHTFVVTRNQMIELDKDGKDVHTITRGIIAAAGKWRNGDIGVAATNGQFTRLDSTGKELKTFPLGGPVYTLGSNLDLLPGGHVLVPLYSLNKVVEFNADGKEVWSATVTQPTSVQRLPNGHTLVTSRLGTNVTELDRNGKEVWTYKVEGGGRADAGRATLKVIGDQ